MNILNRISEKISRQDARRKAFLIIGAWNFREFQFAGIFLRFDQLPYLNEEALI